jgi:ribose 5-phosphate isomerase A
MVQSGMVVGLGSGTTSALMVERLGKRVAQEHLRIVAVATSTATASLAGRLRIPLCELDDVATLDINLDGADEIDPAFRMIKGRGGALLREKIVARSSNRRVTMISGDKRVEHLGRHAPIPVEVSSIGVRHTERRIAQLGARTAIRLLGDGSRYLTDGGNQIVDCWFEALDDPAALDRELQCLAGVLETGLFIDLCDTLLVGTTDGVEQIETHVRERPVAVPIPSS